MAIDKRSPDLTQRTINVAPSATASIFSFSESLGVDENSLVDAFYAMGNGRPGETLDALQRVQVAHDALQRLAVVALRDSGQSWGVVGLFLGVSAQAAHKRYGREL